MAISNGFDETRVLTALTTRLGWQQPTQQGYSTLVSTANLASASGRYFEDFHEAVTIQNLRDIQADALISDDNFNAYLTNLNRKACANSLAMVFNRPQLIESRLLFDKVLNSDYKTIANSGKFCGYRVQIGDNNVSIAINSLSLLFDGVKTFNVYLFNDLKTAPLKTKSVTTVANDQTVIDLTDWVLSYNAAAHKGGCYYIGYFQDDLTTAHALDTNIANYQNGISYYIEGMETPATGGTTFNRTLVGGNYNTYGLNLQLSSYTDFTETIVLNSHLFDELIGLLMAVKVLEAINFSQRSNKGERILQESAGAIFRDVNQEVTTREQPWGLGIKSKVRQEVKRISETFLPKPTLMVTSSYGTPQC